MSYDETFLAPMRAELTRLGVRELRTPAEVDAALTDARGTTLVVVNSICGCAARNARPAVTLALAGKKRPATLTSVFAGQDMEATARARSHLAPHAATSPSIALLKDGKVAYMMERRSIEGRDAESIAKDLREAFEKFC